VALRLERIPEPTIRVPEIRTAPPQRRVILHLSHIHMETDLPASRRPYLLRQPLIWRLVRRLRSPPERAALRPHVPEQIGPRECRERGPQSPGARPGHDHAPRIAR